MKYTRETLLQIFMNGSLTEEAQKAFDQLIKEDALFAEKVTNSIAERIGEVPDDKVNQIALRLDSKVEDIWIKNKPSKITRFFRAAIKGFLVLGTVGVLGYSVSVLWPKLLSALPQIDLSTSSSTKVQTPRTSALWPNFLSFLHQIDLSASNPGDIQLPQDELMPPVMVTQIDHPKTTAVKVMAKKPSIPVPTAIVSNSGSVTQEGDSIRTAIDIDNTQMVDVTVLNPDGILVRHLYQGIWTAGSHFVDWDGRDDAGNLVAPGNYNVVVQAGGKKMSGVVTLKPN
jgi:hypothetical protein